MVKALPYAVPNPDANTLKVKSELFAVSLEIPDAEVEALDAVVADAVGVEWDVQEELNAVAKQIN